MERGGNYSFISRLLLCDIEMRKKKITREGKTKKESNRGNVNRKARASNNPRHGFQRSKEKDPPQSEKKGPLGRGSGKVVDLGAEANSRQPVELAQVVEDLHPAAVDTVGRRVPPDEGNEL